MVHTKNRSGFTLLEIVLSITLLALMALMITRIFSESTRAVEQGKGLALVDETARLILDNVEQDIGQALIRTNVPFRVYSSSGTDVLYFISTAIRRKHSTYPRDTAPVGLRTSSKRHSNNGVVPALNRYVNFQYVTGATGTNQRDIRKLIRHSDYYQSDMVSPGGSMPYTEYLEATMGFSDHASLTFIDFVINGSIGSNRGSGQLPDPNDMPRFVDVVIGLLTARDMQQAMRIYTSRGEDAAIAFLIDRERVYTRRVFMRNTGIQTLELLP